LGEKVYVIKSELQPGSILVRVGYVSMANGKHFSVHFFKIAFWAFLSCFLKPLIWLDSVEVKELLKTFAVFYSQDAI